MVVFLEVLGKTSGQKVGKAEVGKNQPSQTSDGRYFEWTGVNGSMDGGTWFWEAGAINLHVFTMNLRSNITNHVIGRIESPDWGMTEPTEPLFKPGSSGRFIHMPPGGNAQEARWRKI
jgi:hypothetical protein